MTMWIPEAAWVPADERAEGRRVASVTINGVPCLAEAFPVRSRDGRQDAGPDDDTLSMLHAAAAADGPFQTVLVAGRPHVVVVLPHA